LIGEEIMDITGCLNKARNIIKKSSLLPPSLSKRKGRSLKQKCEFKKITPPSF
jgi:hypothetical protein